MAGRYGDGSELDAFDDLPVSPVIEARYLKQPKIMIKHFPLAYEDGSELDGFDDLCVTALGEAKYLKQPVASSLSKAVGVVRLEDSKQQISFLLRLPRELRDQIYNELLCNTYRIELPPIDTTAIRQGYCANADYERAFTVSLHPRLRPSVSQNPQAQSSLRHGDTVAPWSPNFPAYVTYTTLCSREEDRIQRQYSRWKLASSPDCLTILRTSTSTYEETVPMLYNRSTFLFSINSPRKDTLNPRIINLVKNLEIHLDLRTAYLEGSTGNQARTLEFGRRLISKFGGDAIEREVCIISIDYCEGNCFLIQPSLLGAIAKLRGFVTVVLRLVPVYMGRYHQHLFSTMPYRRWIEDLRTWNLLYLVQAGRELEAVLGEALAWFDREDFYCLVFHPRWPNGVRPPKHNVDDLADPPLPGVRPRKGPVPQKLDLLD